jgi:hypothetical protein
VTHDSAFAPLFVVAGTLVSLFDLIHQLAKLSQTEQSPEHEKEIAAERGHYLRPFAKILLALAALREKKPKIARKQLQQLAAEFPENPLFSRELAKLNVSAAQLSGQDWQVPFSVKNGVDSNGLLTHRSPGNQ